MPSNSLIQPLFYYTRTLLHPVYINRLHIRNKREYEGENYSHSTTLFAKNLVRGGTAMINSSSIPPTPLLFTACKATSQASYTREGDTGQGVGVAYPCFIRVMLVFVRPCRPSVLSYSFLYVSRETLLYIIGIERMFYTNVLSCGSPSDVNVCSALYDPVPGEQVFDCRVGVATWIVDNFVYKLFITSLDILI